MKSRSMISLLGGAVAGAAAMYLMDPDMGKRRRAEMAKQAGECMGETRDMLESGWEKASDYAGGLGHTLADKAHEYSGLVSNVAHEYGGQLADQARGKIDQLSGRAQDARADLASQADGWLTKGKDMLRRYGHQAQDYVPSSGQISDQLSDYSRRLWKQARGLGGQVSDRARQSAKSYVGEGRSSAIPVAVTTLGCCVLGAGMMYIVDPRLGRARRAWLMDKSRSLVNRTGKSFYRTGKHLGNRAKGVVAETRGAGEDLLERVRAGLRGVLSDPRVVQVMADANGTITLAGRLIAEEAEKVLRRVESVPGVNKVINRLETWSADAARQSETNRPEGISKL